MNDKSKIRISVPGTIDYLDVIREFVTGQAGSAGFSAANVDEIVLAMDEAVANIIEHAYEDSLLPEDKQILIINIQNEPQELRFTLSDFGQPYDPTVAPDVDLESHYAQAKQDGLGIYMIRQLMDEISYVYDNQKGNMLTLIKHKGP